MERRLRFWAAVFFWDDCECLTTKVCWMPLRTSSHRGHILSAIADLEEYLVGAPENTQALYLLAVALRFKGEPSLALVTLDRLKKIVCLAQPCVSRNRPLPSGYR